MSERDFRPSRAVWLVARREFVQRVRTRAFVVGTLAVLAVIAAYVLFIRFIANEQGTDTLATTPDMVAVAEAVRASADALDQDTVELRTVPDAAAGEALVRDGDADVLLTVRDGAPALVGKDDVQEQLRALVDSVLQQQALDQRLARAGEDPAEVRAEVADTRAAVTTLEQRDPRRTQRLVLGLAIAALLYGSLVFVGQVVAQGVVEEKSSRVVELLLSTVRPWQLLLGKVIGLGAVGLLQMLILAGVGLGVAGGFGLLDVGGLAAGALAMGLLWYLLGVLLYAVVYAAAGSLVSRQEEIQSVLTPLTMSIVIAFVVSVNLLISDPESRLVSTLSLLPPFAPILMPARFALGVAPAWEVGLAIGLALLAIAVLTWLAGRIYSTAVLRTGARVGLRDALRRT
ncbi:MAG TPA: ABC transporter permease [Pseudonocardiaceae bacterium]